MKQKALFLLPFLSVFTVAQPGSSILGIPTWKRDLVQLSQFTPLSFDSWRPYNNPSKIVQVGMNKGEVLAIAGKPDHEESYYQGLRGGLIRISDWYYLRSGISQETALLKFSGETLVRISVTPVQ